MPAEREEREGHERLGSVEAERNAGEESDLGVGRLDEGDGETLLEGGVDGGAVRADCVALSAAACEP